MSLTSTITTSTTLSLTGIVVADSFTETTSHTRIVTSTSTYHESKSTDRVIIEEVVQINVLTEISLTCENALDYYTSDYRWNARIGVQGDVSGSSVNPDIAGIGILVAFFATAGFVILLTLAAYVGGYLPRHYLRRVDRQVLGANSRNEHSQWRKVLEGLMVSLSDQQLVTGLAILVAGYHEMRNNSALDLYHWRIVVYLAWMSSSVHIASLTLLRDVLNKTPMLRNVRVAGMLVLLVLLVVATWPTRLHRVPLFIPAKCLWPLSSLSIDPEWKLSIAMLLFAYLWKLSQLFASSRGWIRKWTVAKPEALLENLMRRMARSRRSVWLIWPPYVILKASYTGFVVYAEIAESFAASLLYLCLAFPYGVSIILSTRGDFADSNGLTFGQLVPLFLLVLPMLLLVELASEPATKSETPEAIYSLMASELLRPKNNAFPDLTTALRRTEPSRFQDKLRNDKPGLHDPIVDHVMSSRALKIMIWTILGIFLSFAFTTIVVTPDARWEILPYVAASFVPSIPIMTVLALPCSRRLR